MDGEAQARFLLPTFCAGLDAEPLGPLWDSEKRSGGHGGAGKGQETGVGVVTDRGFRRLALTRQELMPK